MELSALPWFIRRIIIELVIQDNKEYRFVNKEWFGCVVKRYGSLVFEKNATEEKVLPLVVKNIEEIRFERWDSLDWETILECKNIKHVSIWFSGYTQTQGFENFKSKLIQLSPLKRLVLNGTNIPQLNVLDFLKEQLLHLETLSISLDQYNFGGFSNLASLRLTRLLLIVKEPTSFKILAKVLPNLQGLSLRFYDEFFVSGQLDFDTFESVTELTMDSIYSRRDQKLKVDLSKFPNLKNLSLGEGIGPKDNIPTSGTPSLMISGGAKYLYRVISKSFTEINDIYIYLNIGFDKKDILKIGNLCMRLENLTKLHLSTGPNSVFLENFRAGSSSIKNLVLYGFGITSNLLIWLASKLNLQSLELRSCKFKELKPPKEIMFDQLERAAIACYPMVNDQIAKYINQDTCPKIKDTIFS